MRCPKCKEVLVVTSQERLETLDEHVMCVEPTLKDTYQCINENCPCSSKNYRWNKYGEFYSGGEYPNKTFAKDELTSPYNSFQRKSEVEIYKKGLRKKYVLHPIFMLYFFKPYIDINYKSDMDGNVLSKRYSLKIWAKDENGGYNIGASFCFHTWKYLYGEFIKNIKEKDYTKAFEPSYNKSWDYKIFEWVMKKIYRKEYLNK